MSSRCTINAPTIFARVSQSVLASRSTSSPSSGSALRPRSTVTTTAVAVPMRRMETAIGATAGPTWMPTGTWMPKAPNSASTPTMSMSRAKASSPRGTRGADRVSPARPFAPVNGAGMSDQPDALQRAGDVDDVLGDEVVQFGAGEEGVRPALRLELLLPGIRVVHLGDDALELRAVLVGDAPRRDHPAPVGEDHVVARIGDGGDSGQLLDGLRAGDRQSAHGARLDVLLELADAGDARRDLPAQDQ